MIADLPMYDFAWTAPALDAFWEALSKRLRMAGIDAPAALARARPIEEVWREPALVFGQTCGYPFWTSLRGRVALLATPTYAFAGCDGADHCSFLVVRRGRAGRGLADFRGARAAINARDSNSGANLFRAAVAPLTGGRPFFGEVLVTGAHALSLAALAEDAADIASIDCVTFALLSRGRPDLVAQVEVLARTPSSPGLPFIASAALGSATLAAIRAGLFETLADAKLAWAGAALGLTGARVLEPQAYARVGALEDAAIAQGYPTLA